MPRELSGAVVVITGASSGIGRAAAQLFARRGAHVFLAARADGPLNRAAAECQGATAVPTDVRDEQAVANLADTAIERHGRIDVWVNCAGVIAYGGFDDVPTAIFRNVIETNLFGQVHGARAAVAQFRRQGSGVLINMASVWGRVTTPDVSAYVTSKFAVRAFSQCLRQEVRDWPDIDVVTILPATVDTPIFDRAANYSGKRVRAIPPASDPWRVAEGIVKCAQNPKREITYGRVGRMLELLHSLIPPLYMRIAPEAFRAGNFADDPVPDTPGNVLEPLSADERIDGRWRRDRRRDLISAFLAGAGAGARALLPGSRRRRGVAPRR